MPGDTSSRRESCYICGHANPQNLEEHHLVPRRLGGSDRSENLVYLCGTCHNAIESLYSDEFYHRLGIATESIDNPASALDDQGSILDSSESKDREIPEESPHVTFEDWEIAVEYEVVESEAYKDYEFGDYDEEGLVEAIDDHRHEIIREYEELRKEQDALEEIYEGEDGSPSFFDEPFFEVNHGRLHELPKLRIKHDPDEFEVTEDMDEHEATTARINNRWMEHEDIRLERWADLQSGEVEIDESKIVDRTDLGDFGGTPTRYVGRFQRLHCGYCHVVYTDYEHADMARHLRIQHGIQNPYANVDTTFQNVRTDEERRDQEGGLLDRMND